MGWIDIVGGLELDRYGVKVDKLRYPGESDVDYRVRLKSAPVARNRDDGKSAFPVQGTEMHGAWYGMSLRDYFAAKAMSAIVASQLTDCGEVPHEDVPKFFAISAEYAYIAADAMLAERAKP